MFDSDFWISGPEILKLPAMALFVSASVQPFLHVNYYLAFSFGNISVCLHLEWLGTYGTCKFCSKEVYLEVRKLNINI